MKVITVTSNQLQGRCPRGHRLCFRPRCYLVPERRSPSDMELGWTVEPAGRAAHFIVETEGERGYALCGVTGYGPALSGLVLATGQRPCKTCSRRFLKRREEAKG